MGPIIDEITMQFTPQRNPKLHMIWKDSHAVSLYFGAELWSRSGIDFPVWNVDQSARYAKLSIKTSTYNHSSAESINTLETNF